MENNEEKHQNKYLERITNGILRENPVLVMMIGMCATLAVSTSAINGIGMGLSTTAVLVLSNLIISALRNIIPDGVRIPAFIVVVASLVTIVEFIMEGFFPDLYEALGIYIALIVVNCIILGRAESYASKNPVMLSVFDGIGMGLGFTAALVIIGAIREILGAGQLFGIQILPLADAASGTAGYTPITIFVLAPGAFFVMALVVAVMNKVRDWAEARGVPLPQPSGCMSGNCGACNVSSCVQKPLEEAERVLNEQAAAAATTKKEA